MQELDRLSGGGIIIAATNRRDLLDEALLRRFAIQHEVVPVGKEERKKMVQAFWDAVKIPVPFNVDEYAKREHTPSEIHTDMVRKLTVYLESHQDPTARELEVRDNIVVPKHWAELFLLSAEALSMPDKPCREMEQDQFRVAAIANQIPIPEEENIRYGSEAKIMFDKRADAVRYSIYLCRTAYQEYFHTDRNLTMGELVDWLLAL